MRNNFEMVGGPLMCMSPIRSHGASGDTRQILGLNDHEVVGSLPGNKIILEAAKKYVQGRASISEVEVANFIDAFGDTNDPESIRALRAFGSLFNVQTQDY